MADDRESVAPKERINITYTPETSGAQEEVELPLNLVVLGDFTGRADDRMIEDREPVNVDKDNFNSVMREQNLGVDVSVADRLSGQADAELGLSLKFENLRDFEPEQIARQVPELNTMLELREALVALKGPLGNVPAFRKKIQALLEDDEARARLLEEIKAEQDKDRDKG